MGRRVPFSTDGYSARLRERAIDIDRKQLLITDLQGSKQLNDLSEPVNCGGLGRVHHFKRETSSGWPENPIPIDPACHALGLDPADAIRAQVFQNAACNWRCWYCYVPFENLAASERHSSWIEPSALVDRYFAQPRRPTMIDLSGGQPDLVPEWTPWIMEALAEHGAEDTTFLWIDDNLSNDYFWQYLSDEQIETIATWPHFGRVGCFKGFDEASFAFNTAAAPDLFSRQFDLFTRHLKTGVDCYAYVTLTGTDGTAAKSEMPRFVDRLQDVHELLPLRTVPLEIALWGPVHDRMDEEREKALTVQQIAISAWTAEIEQRFSSTQRALQIHDVPMRG